MTERNTPVSLRYSTHRLRNSPTTPSSATDMVKKSNFTAVHDMIITARKVAHGKVTQREREGIQWPLIRLMFAFYPIGCNNVAPVQHRYGICRVASCVVAEHPQTGQISYEGVVGCCWCANGTMETNYSRHRRVCFTFGMEQLGTQGTRSSVVGRP